MLTTARLDRAQEEEEEEERPLRHRQRRGPVEHQRRDRQRATRERHHDGHGDQDRHGAKAAGVRGAQGRGGRGRVSLSVVFFLVEGKRVDGGGKVSLSNLILPVFCFRFFHL